MTLFLSAVLAAAAFQSFCKLALLPRRWELLAAALLLPLPFLFEQRLAQTSLAAVTASLSGAAIAKSMFESRSRPLVELPGSWAPFQRCGMSDEALLSKAGDASVVVVLEDALEGKDSSDELRRTRSSTMAFCAMPSSALLSALFTLAGLKQSSWTAKETVKGVAQSDSKEMQRSLR